MPQSTPSKSLQVGYCSRFASCGVAPLSTKKIKVYTDTNEQNVHITYNANTCFCFKRPSFDDCLTTWKQQKSSENDSVVNVIESRSLHSVKRYKKNDGTENQRDSLKLIFFKDIFGSLENEQSSRSFMPAVSLNNALRSRHLAPGCPQPSSYSDFPSLQRTLSFISVEFTDFQLGGGGLDPIFGVGFLYDVHGQRRISETFHFDTNPDALLSLLNGSGGAQQQQHREWISTARNFLFRITRKRTVNSTLSSTLGNFLTTTVSSTNFSLMDRAKDNANEEKHSKAGSEIDEDAGKSSERLLQELKFTGDRPVTSCAKEACCASGVFLVIRVEKVLQQGDANDISELYGKDDKGREKIRTTVSWCCQRLGRYRMPLAWTAVDLTPLLIGRSGSQQSPAYSERTERSPYASASDIPSQCKKVSSSGNVKPTLQNNTVYAGNTSSFVSHTGYSFGTRIEKSDISDRNTSDPNMSSLEGVTLHVTTFYKHESEKLTDEELGRYLAEIHRQTTANLVVTRFSSCSVTQSPGSTDQEADAQESPADGSSSILPTLLDPNNSIIKRLKLFPNLELTVRLSSADPLSVMSLLKSSAPAVSGSKGLPQTTHSMTTLSRPLLSPESMPYLGSFFHEQPESASFTADIGICVSKPNSLTMVDTSKSAVVSRPIRDVLELPSRNRIVPFTNIRNLLYIYPRSVVFPASRQASRNIAVRIQLVHEEDSVHKVLPNIFGKSNSTGFVSEAFTTVLYHNRYPEWWDEVKVQLPEQLDSNYYILFTFFHVSCQNKKVESNAVLDMVIGYSWLPVLHEGTLCNSDVTLLVSTIKPTPALTKLRPDLNVMTDKFYVDAFKWVDPTRELFRVSTIIVSSVYPQDVNVEFLLSSCRPHKVMHTLRSLMVRESITQLGECIHNARLYQLIAFLAPIMDGLLRLVLTGLACRACVTSSNNITDLSAFSAVYLLVQFVDQVSTAFPDWYDTFGRNRLLVAYLAGPRAAAEELVLWMELCGVPLFGIPLAKDLLQQTMESDCTENVCLPQEMLRLFRPPSDSNSINRLGLIPLRSWWFLFELWIRLLIQHLMQPDPKKEAVFELTDVPDSLLAELSIFIRNLTIQIVLTIVYQSESELVRSMNQSLAFFLFDLFCLVPAGFVLEQTWTYCATIDDHIRQLITKSNVPADASKLEALLFCKLDLLQIVCAHENHLSMTNITFPIRDLLDGLFHTVNGLVRYSPGVSKSGDGILMAYTAPVEGEHGHPLINNLSHLVLSVLANGLNVNLPKIHWQASSLLCSLLALHEADPRLSTTVRKQLQKSHKAHSLSAIACLYIGLLDLLVTLIRRIVDSWRAFVAQSDFPAHFRRPVSSRSLMDDGSDKASVSSIEAISFKSHSRKKRFVKGSKDSICLHNSINMTPKNSSSNFSLHGTVTNSPDLPRTDLIQVITLKNLLLSSVWVMYHADEAAFSKWIRDANKDSRHRLIVILYIVLNLFKQPITPDSSGQISGEMTFTRQTPKTKSFHSVVPSRMKSSLFQKVRQRAGSASRVPSQPTGFQPSTRVDVDRTSMESQQSLQQQRRYSSNLNLRPDDGYVPSWLASTSTLAVTTILERITTILWDLDCSQGLPGLSLFTSIQSEFDQLIPYRKPNCDLGNTTTLLDTISRVLLFALSLDQSNAAYCQLLRCLKQIMEKFPNFVFEDNPHWLSGFVYHLLSLCALNSHAVRSQASLLLFHVMRSHYMLNKNLSQIRSNLYTAFAPLYTPNQQQEDLHPNRLKCIPFLQRHVNLKDSLRNLRTFVTEDTASATVTDRSVLHQSDGDLKGESLSSTKRSVSSPIFQAMENDGLLNFSAQVTQLVKNLCELSEDATRMQSKISSSHVHTKSPVDSEYILSLIDTLYSMANRCRLSPEMRLYWLLQIMERHNELSHFAEAAQCLAHCAAIVAEHLVNRDQLSAGLKLHGCVDLADAVGNFNVLEESCVCGQKDSSLSHPSCQAPVYASDLAASFAHYDTSHYFTTAGWTNLISMTAEAFSKAGLYEFVPRIYGKLIPMLETLCQYAQLSDVHGEIKDAYLALQKQQHKKRLFNAYFRVGFYGTLLGPMNGSEYVYREVPFTKLPEMTQRITAYYAEKFGEDRIVVIKDSNVVNPRTLDSNKVYFQITYVEPYFEDYELRRRTTELQKNYVLKRFVHSLPFTPKGPAHGSLSEQFQRQVILTTERHFPYIKSRLAVVSRTDQVLSPIEVAYGDVSRRVEQLEIALRTKPVDVKFLQMILQGCIGTTVNQGPVEVALTFLKPGSPVTPLPESTFILNEAAYVDAQNRLRVCFRQMLQYSYHALCVNRDMIGMDQLEYHRELERQFKIVTVQLTPLLKLETCPDRK
ncbi:hypothetical protein EG68_00019 [Paragonimus skrjabini miyazakii]|uniref:Uncharacterized protein n=1 Tax=Paragonimus skrjabini miyazakii TaxID=59628 RepID=A0A8S9ZCY5_9TREM|nr:hypothetical protein EG68_00019 [Paragonimus skrjabini miyazakii]